MHIEKLSLLGFKNYDEAVLTFTEGINFVCGPNGSGKTNILEAIHYLSMTRGAHNTIDSQNVKMGNPYFSIKGLFLDDSSANEIVCFFQEGTKKSFKVNKQDYDKLSNHIGKYPVVLMAPNDSDLIRDSSETRRKFVDSIICQVDHDYMVNLQKYNHNLKQRNALLKQLNKPNSGDSTLLDQYDNWMIKYGGQIHHSRELFLKEFLLDFRQEYGIVSDHKEDVSIEYKSDFKDADFQTKLNAARKKDILLERSTLGIHRDDFKFFIDNHQPLKKYGSQGQQKSYTIALKLAQFSFMQRGLEIQPILLLDDIFDKLDKQRISKLLALIKNNKFGQVIITDAIEERTKQLVNELNLESNFISIKDGTVI